MTTIYTDRARQLRGMISMHRRTEKAYRSCGKTEQADAAKAQAEKCEAELYELEGK